MTSDKSYSPASVIITAITFLLCMSGMLFYGLPHMMEPMYTDSYHPTPITVLNKTDDSLVTQYAEHLGIETDRGMYYALPEIRDELAIGEKYVVNVWGEIIVAVIREGDQI
jgi:hypothetical protein